MQNKIVSATGDIFSLHAPGTKKAPKPPNKP